MAIGEAFLSAFLQVLFDRLASKHVVDFILPGSDIDDDLKKLKIVKAVLNDAEDKQFKDEEVKIWLDDLKDAAYDAEDVLDEFAYEALRSKLEPDSQSSSNQVWSFIPASFNPFNGGMESKLKAIIERFEELSKQRFEQGLEEVAAGRPTILRETSSVVDDSRVYGRDDDKEKIINLLLNDHSGCDDNVSVVPIVGMGGIGKTTLAQIVYNDSRVESHFELKAWVCVSEQFNVRRITKAILHSVTSIQTSDLNDLNLVQVEVKKAFKGKKFLIVLDDVWSKNYGDWDVLQNPFKAGAMGSKIIVTTRDREVASMMGTVDDHYLENLSYDACWSVFVQHAHGKRNINAKTNLEVIGKKIVDKCKGLPLAARTLGGLLRYKLEEDEWEDILNSKIWDLPKEGNDILPALRLSYHHLPSHLKRCFAYCSIFPKDYEFAGIEIVQFWMAEGLVQQPNQRKQMEDIGLGYFRDLVSRSFFQQSSSNKSRFVMHDHINDLAQFVAGGTCFRLEGMLDSEIQCNISRKARHSCYVGSGLDGVKKFEAFDKVECLRTFLPLTTSVGGYVTNNVLVHLLPKLRCLRVFSLRGYRIIELPNSIGDLKHLRYLDLSCTKIRSLPETTSSLYNLETLNLEECSSLQKLPTRMQNLINLRHLCIKGSYKIKEMPLGIGYLTGLQILSNFSVGNGISGSGIRELGKLQHLRETLWISRLENVFDAQDAREANLKDKQDLDELLLEWSFGIKNLRDDAVEKEVLEMLQPHKKLKKLTIRYYGGTRFPTWMGHPSFSNMVLLRLQNCVKCTSLPPLGLLPSLQDLYIQRIHGVSSVGIDFNGEGCPKPFPSLKTLRFVDMAEWEVWHPFGVDRQVEIFPCLRNLSIERCPKLSGILPGHLASLEVLMIYGCPQLAVSISSFPKLCKLDIQECQDVVKSNLVNLSSLKSMVLSDSSMLTHLSKGFMQSLTKVEDLEIVGCNELTSLWQKDVGLLQHLTFLHNLKITRCPKFVSFEAEEAMQQQLGVPCMLESLELYACYKLEKLQGLYRLASLRELTINRCPLVSFPETGLPSMLRKLRIELCVDLESLHQAMMHWSNYASLDDLVISECYSLTSIARGQLPSTIKNLKIVNCYNLQCLVELDDSTTTSSLHNKSNNSGELPAALEHLYISGCSKLESVAEKLHNNTSLESIQISNCKSLKSLPEGLHNLSHLCKFEIFGCRSVVSFPNGGLPATNLRELQIKLCVKLEALPEGMNNLTSLQDLSISYNPGIVSFPKESFPTNLTSLSIEDIKNCKPLIEWGLYGLASLRVLYVQGPWPDLVSFPDEEDRMMLPASLTSLSIVHFPNLKCLFSKGFQRLTSLEHLKIKGCPKLKSFPEEGLPPSLLRLDIYGCPLLKQQCNKDQGQDWPKIAHIPCVYIDDRFIYDPEEE